MRLAIIDDHPSTIQGVSSFTAQMAEPPSVVGYGSMEAFESAHEAGARFNLVLLDLTIPGYTELHALEHFRSKFPDIPVVVLSGNSEPRVIWESIDRLNAMGFIPKSASAEVTVEAIERVLGGKIFLPPEIYQFVQARAPVPGAIDTPESPRRSEAGLIARSRTTVLGGLTARQRDVLGLILKGMSDKLICRELDISQNTVKTHKNAVYRALGVNDRLNAAIKAQELGLRVNYSGHDVR